MAMFVHSIIEATGGETHWDLNQTCRYESFDQEEEYMTRRIPQIILALTILTPYISLHSQSKETFNGFALVDKSGNISKPADYREKYEFLGTYTVIDPKGDQMHVTYASPGTIAYYRKTGKFPDGAVLVKEIFLTDHAKLTTGNAQWASQMVQWFVKIKDTKNRYPNNPLWGDGWGWALFKADAPDKQVATDYKKDCLGCHIPAQSTDWIYVKGYPVLASK
jgi:Cytochrome P460